VCVFIYCQTRIFGAQFILVPLAQTYDSAKLNCALKFKDEKSKYNQEILMIKLSEEYTLYIPRFSLLGVLGISI
jgi:hypothetical protein